MECERDFECFLPKAAPARRAPQSYLSNGHSTSYKTGRTADRLLAKATGHLLGSLEPLVGPLYSFTGAPPFLAEWQRKLLRDLYDQQTTTTSQLVLDPPFNDEPKLFMIYIPPLIRDELIHGATLEGPSSFGASCDFDEAFSKAVGEFLERYALLHWRAYPTREASAADLRRQRRPCLDLKALTRFSDAQQSRNGSRRLQEDAPLRWVEGRRLDGGAPIWLPAQLVFWNYATHATQECVLGEPNTNGAGGMFTLRGAILSGLRELIQRDGFFLYWLNTVAPPRLDLSTLKGEAAALVAAVRRYRFEIEILDITSEIGLPAFASVLMDPSEHGNGVYIGAGCEGAPEEAIAHAIIESLIVYHSMRKRDEILAWPDPYEPFVTPLGHLERLSLWANPEMFERVRWFLAGPRVTVDEVTRRYQVPREPEDELNALCERLQQMGPGYEISYYEATHPILAKVGYRVVKVIVPAFAPMYLEERNAPLGCRRLLDGSRALGGRAVKFPNPLPHPFP